MAKPVQYGELTKMTMWIGQLQWKRFGEAVGTRQRSDAIREYIDRIIARDLQKKKGFKK